MGGLPNQQLPYVKAPKACQIFMYTEKAGIPSEHLSAMRKAGFIPVRVNSFDDVKLMHVEPIIVGDSYKILSSLLDACASSGYSSVWEHFGRGIGENLKQEFMKQSKEKEKAG